MSVNPVSLSGKQVENLLRDLSIIDNAYKDIEDAIQDPKDIDLAKIRAANARIGAAANRHLPG